MPSTNQNRRVKPPYLKEVDGKLLRVLQIETRTEEEASVALKEAMERWIDSMGGICHTADRRCPLGWCWPSKPEKTKHDQ